MKISIGETRILVRKAEVRDHAGNLIFACSDGTIEIGRRKKFIWRFGDRTGEVCAPTRGEARAILKRELGMKKLDSKVEICEL